MIDNEEIRLLAQIGAMKLMLGRAYTMIYRLANLPAEKVAEMNDNLIQSLHRESLVVTDDPALSDLLSAEIQEQIRLLLQGVEQDLGLMPR